MRWVQFDTSVNGIFSREVSPEDSEYLQAHMDTFKCMWHEQTRNYWARMVISLREYVKKHIFTYESLERLGAPVSIFEMIIEYSYINICTNFAEDSFGKAKEFLRAIISVCANRDMMYHIGARPLSNDPFYNKFTRDFYRTVFGQPSSMIKLQIQTHIAMPLYARFAAGVVALIKQWVRATDCSLKELFMKFHMHPYWTYPDDYCPHKGFFEYIDEKFQGWESPNCLEIETFMNRAPDRETSFAEVVELLDLSPADNADYSCVELSDCSSEGSEDSFCPHGIKLWSEIVFGVSDQLLDVAPFHVRDLCSTCMAMASSDYSSDEESDDEILFEPEGPEGCLGLLCSCNFWLRPEVIALLDVAQKRYVDKLVEKLTGEATKDHQSCSNNNTVLSKRQRKRLRKKARDVVSISINVKMSASSQQPASMKNGAKPPSTSRPKMDSNKTSPSASSQQQAGATSKAPKPQKASKSQEGTRSQEAVKAPDKPSPKKAEAKAPLASGGGGASKAAGPSKKVDKKPLVNGDNAVSNAAGPSKKSNKKLLVNDDAALSKPLVRKCATCGKNEGIKLKKCSLCVKMKMDPAFYCSRECQTEDWDNHQAVHLDDID